MQIMLELEKLHVRAAGAPDRRPNLLLLPDTDEWVLGYQQELNGMMQYSTHGGFLGLRQALHPSFFRGCMIVLTDQLSAPVFAYTASNLPGP